MYVCSYKEQNNKKHNRESCVTVRYNIYIYGVYNSNVFEVYKLWYAYVVMECFTTTKKERIYIYIYL